MKKSSLKNLAIMISFLLGIVAIISLFFPAFIKTSDNSVNSYSLIGFVIGKVSLQTKTKNNINISFYDGGLSTFALISFILIALGLLVIISSFFIKKNNILLIIGGITLIVGSIFIWMIKVNGSDIVFAKIEAGPFNYVGKKTFAEFFNPENNYTKDFNYGYGLIIYFVASLLSGLISIGSSFIVTKKR